jgi:hypothetical protein
MSPPPEGILLGGHRPGALAEVVALHMARYAPEWGFGRAFATKVAGELAAFPAGADPARDPFLCRATMPAASPARSPSTAGTPPARARISDGSSWPGMRAGAGSAGR